MIQLAPLQHSGRVKYSLVDNKWPSAPEIIEIIGVDNAIYNGDGTSKQFSSEQDALDEMISISDNKKLIANSEGAALFDHELNTNVSKKVRRLLGYSDTVVFQDGSLYQLMDGQILKFN